MGHPHDGLHGGSRARFGRLGGLFPGRERPLAAIQPVLRPAGVRLDGTGEGLRAGHRLRRQSERSRKPWAPGFRDRTGWPGEVAVPGVSRRASAFDRPVHRGLQGPGPSGRDRRALRVCRPCGQPLRRPHPHGHRIGGLARSRPSLHGRRRLLPGPQRIPLQPLELAPAPGEAGHRFRDRQRHRSPPAASWSGG